MTNQYSVAAHWSDDFNDASLQGWAENLRQQLSAPSVSVGLVFMAPKYFPRARQILEILRVHARIPLLAGCSSQGLIVNGEEIEENAGLTLALYHLPNGEFKATHFSQEQVEEANGPGYWIMESGVEPEQTNGWLAFINPFNVDSESWLSGWNEAYAPLPVMGGLASGNYNAQQTQVYLNGEVFEEGGVALSVGGEVQISGITSQGCTPIGETWTLTRVDRNIIQEIGNRRAYDVLAETFSALTPDQQRQARGNLFIGMVVNEYLDDFHRGDFLIRNLLQADPKTGNVAVGALPRQGQTVQFQRRSAEAATEDMTELLKRARREMNKNNKLVYGACLCCCNGRGRNLFGEPNHDARMVQQHLGPLGLAGFFCNGEIGPVGEKNFLHGYTASLALFAQK